MTLKSHYALCFKARASFGAHHENLNEDRLYYQRRRCSRPMNLFWHVRFMRIFALVLKIYVNFLWTLCLRPYITCTRTSRFFVIKFNCFLYNTYLPIRLRRVVKCATSGDVSSGVAECDPQSIWNPRKNCGSSVDATSSEYYLTNDANIS